MREPGSDTNPAAQSGIRVLLSRRVLVLVSLFLTFPILGVWIIWLTIVAGISPVEGFTPRLDFQVFWAASSLALKGAAGSAYDAATIQREQLPLHGDASGYYSWLNPPVFFFFVLPLSLVPVAASVVAWVGVTGGLALTAVRRIASDKILATVVALVFPATFYNLMIGQNGFLTAGLFAWGMLLLRDRPILAGVALGLLAYKPQFLPLVLIALLAGRQKQAAASAFLCIAGTSAASLVVFGVSSWEGFISVVSAGDSIYRSDGPVGVALSKMQSVSALLLLLGVSPLATQMVQVAAFLCCSGFVIWLWRKDVAFEYKAAGLAIAVLLATPYSYHYDLTLLGLAILWLGNQFHKEGWRAWDAELLLLAGLTPVLALIVGLAAGIAVTPLVLLLLLFAILRRVRETEPVAVAGNSDSQQAVATATR